MSEFEFDKSLCENCGKPLFLNKEECKEFIKNKMKNGYIVCSCCGVGQSISQEKIDECK
jgi:hypothetical protein